MPVIELPHLQALALTLGSLTNSDWPTQIPTLRYLALRQVRKLSDLTPVTPLRALQWLWLETLTVERLPDFSSSTMLTRAECLGMCHLRHPAALQGLAAAPQLRELLVAAPHLPVDAVVPFVITRHSNAPRSCWAANSATAARTIFCGCHHHARTRSSPRCTN
ncbi:hypothetical protein PSN13_01433 [Micromonospora saelicesensis]|uniref:Uncharacterized protein n=1 Tax=Micromonospora saelicesensis TaxID=285676 RepID=A0A328NYF5_9ACTN|nr:hypothetical protein [Micromonospora saelicesensis]RAO37451.1 hypothetical protein PSN13_01433 [Micromonospora saelicesensis]